MNAEAGVETGARNKKRECNLSPDGKWRSFPKVPNLLQYVGTGKYYARTKVLGKIVRRSLKTTVWSDAKLCLIDFLKEQKSKRDVPFVSFSTALTLYEKTLANDVSIKPRTLEYWRLCMGKIKTSWPEILETDISQITESMGQEWARKLSKEISSRYFNNTIAALRHVLACGIKEYVRLSGSVIENPAQHLSRVAVRQKELRLPEASQFHELVENIRMKSGVWSPDVADLVEFLSYSGARAFSEAAHFAWEDIDWKRKELIIRGDPETLTKNSEVRRVPMLPNMEDLLTRIKAARESEGEPLTGKVLKVTECRGALARACRELGIQKLTHHDLRHLFATRCIESGVDIPTVARWLGHKDGGTLAMKTYGHLRNEHSQAMAQKVRF